jgi:hypothetical protein
VWISGVSELINKWIIVNNSKQSEHCTKKIKKICNEQFIIKFYEFFLKIIFLCKISCTIVTIFIQNFVFYTNNKIVFWILKKKTKIKNIFLYFGLFWSENRPKQTKLFMVFFGLKTDQSRPTKNDHKRPKIFWSFLV